METLRRVRREAIESKSRLDGTARRWGRTISLTWIHLERLFESTALFVVRQIGIGAGARMRRRVLVLHFYDGHLGPIIGAIDLHGHELSERCLALIRLDPVGRFDGRTRCWAGDSVGGRKAWRPLERLMRFHWMQSDVRRNHQAAVEVHRRCLLLPVDVPAASREKFGQKLVAHAADGKLLKSNQIK